MIKQQLQLKLSQKLSPQQIQLMKLMQLSTLDFEQRLQNELEENPAFFTLKSTTISRWSKLGSLFKEGGLIKGKSIGTSDGQLIEYFHNFKIDKNNIVISFDTIIRIYTPDGDPDAASRIVQKTYTRVVAAV